MKSFSGQTSVSIIIWYLLTGSGMGGGGGSESRITG